MAKNVSIADLAGHPPITHKNDRVRALQYPHFRFMGSKHRLIPWIHEILSGLSFKTAIDAFSGSGCVAYLLKSMGKTVTANDFLNFSYHLARALVVNPGIRITENEIAEMLEPNPKSGTFIQTTFQGIFFNSTDLKFLDNTWTNLQKLNNPWKESLAIGAMCRSAIKKQPRGVFTVGNSRTENYDDGRRDIRLSMQDHFVESIALFNELIYDDGLQHRALCKDVFEIQEQADLVYMDPPYVPRRDDNCYIKRYHFLEGLSCYWHGMEILSHSKVKKIRKRYTPFSYRKNAKEAFDDLFKQFADSVMVLSYSSNGYPDLDDLVRLMKSYKPRVSVIEHSHRYHFGTHKQVSPERAVVHEYLIIGE